MLRNAKGMTKKRKDEQDIHWRGNGWRKASKRQVLSPSKTLSLSLSLLLACYLHSSHQEEPKLKSKNEEREKTEPFGRLEWRCFVKIRSIIMMMSEIIPLRCCVLQKLIPLQKILFPSQRKKGRKKSSLLFLFFSFLITFLLGFIWSSSLSLSHSLLIIIGN